MKNKQKAPDNGQQEDGFKKAKNQDGKNIKSQELRDPRLRVISSSGIKDTGYMSDVGRR